MLTLIRRPIGPGGRRRGVTLVEMLVVVALVVLMMVILVQIFQAATGAMTSSRTIQELDVALRQVDSIIRADLVGSTSRMTPPNDPKDKRGYFEYGENAFADPQGEDTDDYLAFTTRAAEGKSFTGRQWLGPPANQNIQPTTITSQVAEVVYFLRNGNLYRRVFLVAPERAKSITVGSVAGNGYITSIFGGSIGVSWQGMNDISCRPNPTASNVPIPNDLGDLTNRENRAFRPRFANDLNPANGIPDDNNFDGVPDYHPTLYYDGAGLANNESGNPGWAPNSSIRERVGYPTATARRSQTAPGATNLYAFPYIYPGMYSVPDAYRASNNLGSIHEIYPFNDPDDNPDRGLVPNQAPLDLGDNLPLPSANQTWWGFPTWRETMAGTGSGGGAGWTDPVNFITRNTAAPGFQPLGLQPYLGSALPTANAANLLPPIYRFGTATAAPFHDGAGSSSFVAAPLAGTPTRSIEPNPIWEDDLLLTNVRSFDIKAYDPNAPLYNTTTNGYFSAGYQDLGYGAASYLGGPVDPTTGNPGPAPFHLSLRQEPVGFGHEGRMPPRINDFRAHPRRGYNIGDNAAGVIRLTRVWDSWSTDYTNAPDSDVFLNGISPNDPPIYPSFPAPYPSPLRGIQIQIRLGDPRGEKAKSITIRHDFSDKL